MLQQPSGHEPNCCCCYYYYITFIPHCALFDAVRGSAEEKCGLILRHIPARLVSRCSYVIL